MRRWKGWGAATVIFGLTLAGLLVSRPAQAQNAIPLFSGNNWTTYAANPLPGTPPPPALGPARAVCLNPGSPLFCGVSVGGVPPMFYGYPGNGWSAKTSMAGICGKANWVWAPGVKGATPHASLATYYFSRTVLLTIPPTAPATLSVAVDDYAEVWVNGTSVAALGSTTVPAVAGAAQNSFHAVDITAFLLSGSNVITIKAQNGDFCTASPIGCTYQQNPAGVIFCGLIPQ